MVNANLRAPNLPKTPSVQAPAPATINLTFNHNAPVGNAPAVVPNAPAPEPSEKALSFFVKYKKFIIGGVLLVIAILIILLIVELFKKKEETKKEAAPQPIIIQVPPPTVVQGQSLGGQASVVQGQSQPQYIYQQGSAPPQQYSGVQGQSVSSGMAGHTEISNTGGAAAVASKSNASGNSTTRQASVGAPPPGKSNTPPPPHHGNSTTREAPSGPTPATWKSTPGVDYPGNDIKALTKTNPSKCEAECAKTPGCVAVVTNKAGDACWLKSKLVNQKKQSDRIVYANPHPTHPHGHHVNHWKVLKGVDYPGNDIKHTSHSSVTKCNQACANTPGCVAAVTNNKGDECWLKNKLGNQIKASDRVTRQKA